MKKSFISIEVMRPEHTKNLAEISRECFSEYWSQEAFLSEMSNKNSVTFVAVDEFSNAVGFINAHCILDECFLNNIALYKKFQNQKIGQALLDKLCEYAVCQKVLTITLEVRMSNENAKNFYYKNNFVKVGLRKEFYQNPTEDALLLTKVI
ncbi:MAG: ribosomal protein S18-alanine N-acetyltransferase [Oscillospiraceae bacterium]